MKLENPKLVALIVRAYSAERAASYAYIGHALSLSDAEAAAEVRQIEADEWAHRACLADLMEQYEIGPSRTLEWKYAFIGAVIAISCQFIGRFMPYFFAGRLESGNVCEYFVMIHLFHELGIREHDEMLFEMGVKEKEHEVYFLEAIRNASWLPLFERIFSWGKEESFNDLDWEDMPEVSQVGAFCKR